MTRQEAKDQAAEDVAHLSTMLAELRAQARIHRHPAETAEPPDTPEIKALCAAIERAASRAA